jgi:type I restriction enzyme S subunit
MTGWSTKRLENLVSSPITYGVVKPGDYDSDGVKLIRGGDICRGKISNNLRTVSPLVSQQYQRTVLQGGELLVSLVGNPGEVALVPNELAGANLARQAGMVRLNDEVDPRFALYYFMSPPGIEQMMSKVMGSVQQVINLSDLKEVEITYPSPYEQRAIAVVLSSIDDKIDLLHRQNQTLEAMAATLFRQWFVEEAQEDWEVRPLSSIANFLNGLACQKHPPKNELEKLPVLKIKELSGGISESSDFASSEIKPEYIVEAGDVIFAWSASLMVKVWDGERCVLNQHLFKVTSNEFPKWFYLMWCKHHLAEFISISSSHATTMGHIKRGDLDAAMVSVPPENELKAMSEQMTPLLEKQIAIASKRSTNPRLFSAPFR